MNDIFRCGHLNVVDNRAKVGKGRTGCRTCRMAWKAKNPDTRTNRRAKPKVVAEDDDEVVVIPGRLALRRFSWEDEPASTEVTK